jgi:hypothetical protein
VDEAEAMEETDVLEIKEKLEELSEHDTGWTRYLAITTALIAVAGALASLESGALANAALLEKDDAVLSQSRASNEWAHYQATSIKVHLLENAQATPERADALRKYQAQKEEIAKRAEELQTKVDESNRRSSELFERHHRIALSVTTFQIAIALSAMSALLERRSFWAFSLAAALAGLISFGVGFLG